MSDDPGCADLATGEYVQAVEQFYLLLRRRGLMLSPKDWEIAEAWARGGIPLRVVFRAILRATDGFRTQHGTDKPLPFSLSYFDPAVRDEMRHETARELRPDDEEVVLDEAREAALRTTEALLEEVVAVGRREQDPARTEAYRNLWRGLARLRSGLVAKTGPIALVEGLIALDGALLDEVWATLDEGERAGIEAAVEGRLASMEHTLSEAGLAERRRALRDQELTRRCGLLRVWE